ncbi:phospholipase A2 inhibitor and Ly6/PLAUR domain-containing protein-like [Spea bombifrons]|uniref:phospholipase A2 inhibitor and Ly6/PLAUR domain-containing protein-like n=1 Tax=Spea bombifrons TaxID=233779 RepID=UPI00234A28E6|nr:phospholipase A2 inhibitor and Ly6/PLAUR domain-containing protein-like [Spea bombifrons]
MKVLLGLISFTIAVIAGEALMCKQCLDKRADDCQGESVICDLPGGMCAKGIEHNILNGDVVPTAFRACTNDTRLCGGQVSLSTAPFQLLLYTECCQEDDCNCGEIIMPPKNTTKNGVVCRSCFTEGDYSCTDVSTIECTGNEAECIEFSGQAARPEEETMIYSYYGCVTKGVCQIGFGGLPGSVVYEQRVLECTPSIETN